MSGTPVRSDLHLGETMTAADTPTPDSLSADLRRLEDIVRQLESDDCDLDKALILFEEGVARLRAARERLSEAEARVQKVLEDAAGQLTVTDFEG
jgi:exodeoxyribonuclease VII small subunit